MLSPPKEEVALNLLGLKAFMLVDGTSDNTDIREKKEFLRGEVQRVASEISDKQLTDYALLSGEATSANSQLAQLVEVEKAKTEVILARDRERVNKIKASMRKEVARMAREELEKKRLHALGLEREVKFSEKMHALEQARHKASVQREIDLKRKAEAKQELLKALLQERDEMKILMEERMQEKFLKVQRVKESIRMVKKRESDAFNTKLNTVRAKIDARYELDRIDSQQILDELMVNYDRIKQKRLERMQSWIEKGKARREQYVRRLQARSELLGRDSDGRESLASDLEAKRILRMQKVASNRDERRKALQLTMEKVDQNIEQTVVRGKSDLARKINLRKEKFEMRFLQLDRTQIKRDRAESRIKEMQQKNSRYRILFNFNVGRIQRRSNYMLRTRIAHMKRTNDRITALKNTEQVRTAKQKILRENWIEKDLLLRKIDRLKRVGNDGLDKIMHELGVTV